MKNNIKAAAGAVITALCFLTVFLGAGLRACAESAQLTHRHTGSRQNGGGCYGAQKTETWDCRSYQVSVGHNGTDYIYVCGQCGTRWSSHGKVDEPRCSGQGTTTYYEVNCGKSNAAAVSFSCEPSTREWARELDLTASYIVHESGISISGFLWDTSPGGTSRHVTENGTYTLGLTGSGNVDFSPTVSVTVDHIDRTAPAISSFQTASAAWGSSAELSVSASDSESGLAAEAYSYDGGASWSPSPVHTVTENGTYHVSVRDAVGNVSTAEAAVSHIDRTPPTVSIVTDPSVDNWYDGGLTVMVRAQDAESGLADAPYSFDGGAGYLVGNSVVLSGSGTLDIAVADRAGNVTHLTFRAEKKQRPQPTAVPEGGGGSANAGSGGTSAGTGSGNGSGSVGTGSGAGGNTGTGGNESGGTVGDGTGNTGTGVFGSGNAAAGGSATGGAGGASGGMGSGNGGNSSGAGGAAGSGISGTAGSGTGNTKTGSHGNTGDGARTKNSGSETGQRGSAGAGKGSYEEGKRGSLRGALPAAGGVLPQHYPNELPRVESMTGNHQSGTGEDAEYGVQASQSENTGHDIGEIRSENPDGGAAVDQGEDEILQEELFSGAGGQEAAVLQKTYAAGNGSFLDSAWMLPACVIVLAGAVLFGWVLLFGIRIDTRDEKGRYRFAGITRVTADRQERLRVVPLTKQIIRNSKTNALRIRFGALCHKRCEGETLLLRYRSMKREFQEEKTVELHIRA